MNLPGGRRQRAGRPRPGARGRLPETQLCPGRARRSSDLGRHGVAATPGLLLLEPGRAAGPRPEDGRDGDDARPIHVDWRGHRDGPGMLRFIRAGNWPSGLYFVRLTAGDGRVGYAPFVVRRRGAAITRRGRPLDEHLAGLQLLGRGRRRLGRQLVRERRDAKRRPGSPVSRLRRPVPLPRLGPRLHRLAEPDGEAGRLPLRRRPRGVLERRPAGGGVRPRRLPRACRVRDGARLRRRPALPQPRREPHVPRREQLLLEGAARRAADDAGAALAKSRAAGGGARRRPVRRRATTGRRQGAYIVRAAASAPWAFAGTGLGDGDVFGTLRHRDRRPRARLPGRHSSSSPRSRT